MHLENLIAKMAKTLYFISVLWYNESKNTNK